MTDSTYFAPSVLIIHHTLTISTVLYTICHGCMLLLAAIRTISHYSLIVIITDSII